MLRLMSRHAPSRIAWHDESNASSGRSYDPAEHVKIVQVFGRVTLRVCVCQVLYCKPHHDSLLRELTSIIHRAEP